MKIKLLCAACLILLLTNCELTSFGEQEVGIVDGLRPIYVEQLEWDEIIALPPKPIEFLGKIYYKDQRIYVNERNKGIHIIDNSDPSNPVPIKFIQIYGSEDIAIKGNILYADNLTDLVAIDITDLDNIVVTSRIAGLYPEDAKNYPAGYSGYFECVDPDLGIVIGWEEAQLDNPACLR